MKTKHLINTANIPETMEVYEAPVIETVEVQIEQGFQLSSPASPDDGNPDYVW